jgi:hypothetical protein
MNKVPKCIQCKDLHQYDIGKHTYYDCYNDKIYGTGKKIYSKDIKTSPKWCPLRQIEEEKIKKHVERLIRKIGNNTVLKYK